eukprot:COSAG06_NODE_16582_length_992_cov_4.147816_1_plen_36_part_10
MAAFRTAKALELQSHAVGIAPCDVDKTARKTHTVAS